MLSISHGNSVFEHGFSINKAIFDHHGLTRILIQERILGEGHQGRDPPPQTLRDPQTPKP